MASVEASLNAVHAAGLRLIVAGEDDKGMWLATVATGRTANMKTWKTGRGNSLDAAMADAIKKRGKAKPAAADDSFEDILG